MVKNLKMPIRTCIGCKCKKPKKEMIRIIRTPDGKIEIDKTGKKSGRGAYLCGKVKCLDAAFRENSLNKSLKQDIPLVMLDELRKTFLNNISENY
ncbi:DNA-binding protein [Candidatus Atribacteria bacterium RBG_19FT_COMBO_35_14]|uniref:DNA-binding protein n=1 Tax=Candidatus Sediminicultor quintus TaxID=1797291 RepID=A0A1F5A907_9BACT|nr:MAG: DNA-binding protein [Candidatus Atribacteria bacterium RBG_19FT_COMBO_35_14]OGD36903.1 MAG: DNA-binding protein [Candidatus Atribacteria bacterium RBG_16_35_8]